MPHPTRKKSAAAIATLLTVAATSPAAADAASEADALARSRSAWETSGVDEYRYGYNKYCDCHREDPPETLVSVRGGDVVDVRHRPYGTDREVVAEQRNLQYYWTVEGLFGLIANAIERNVELRTDYDDALGYPTMIFIDYDSNLIGDELDLRITRLEPATP